MRSTLSTLIYGLGFCLLLSSCAGQERPAERQQADVAEVVTETSLAAYDAGKELYMTHCYFCHGKSADGQGPLSASMEGAKPRDFRRPSLALAHPDSLKRVILEGGEAVGLSEGMPAWNSVLTSADADMLVAFIQVVSKRGGLLPDASNNNTLNLTTVPPESQPTY